jgi:hypothetical protein
MKEATMSLPGRRCAVGLLIAGASGLAAAQGQPFPIVPPKLPPRSAVTATPSPAQPAQPGYAPQAPAAHGSAAQPSYPSAIPAATVAGYATAGQVQPPGSASAYRAPAPASYGAPYGAPAAAALAPATVVQPAKAAAGACRAQPSPDRQTLSLVSGPEALPRDHVPLGEYRAQQVLHSADGRWAVVFTKLRGRPQFAALTIDLERCALQRTIELPGAGGDAEFQGDDAVLRFDGGERRVALRDRSMR